MTEERLKEAKNFMIWGATGDCRMLLKECVEEIRRCWHDLEQYKTEIADLRKGLQDGFNEYSRFNKEK